MPYYQVGMALHTAPGGDVIIEKLSRNEPLTAAEEKKHEQAQEEAGNAGLSQEQAQNLLSAAAKEFEQKLWSSRKAERSMADLHAWAEKEYPNYQELRKTPAWDEKIGTILDAIQKRTIPVPDDWDPYRYAVDQAYGWLKGLDPEIGKVTPSKTTEKDRRAAISQASVQAGGVAPEESDSLPDYANLNIQPRSATGGRAFSSLKRS